MEYFQKKYMYQSHLKRYTAIPGVNWFRLSVSVTYYFWFIVKGWKRGIKKCKDRLHQKECVELLGFGLWVCQIVANNVLKFLIYKVWTMTCGVCEHGYQIYSCLLLPVGHLLQ